MVTTPDDILDRKAGEAPRPGLCAGTFRLRVKDFERGESTHKKTPYVRFKCGVLAALDGKPEDLIALGDLSMKVEEIDFYLTENSLFRLEDFIEVLGLKMNGRTYKQIIPESAGKEFIAHYSGEEIIREGKQTGQYRYRPDSFAPAK